MATSLTGPRGRGVFFALGTEAVVHHQSAGRHGVGHRAAAPAAAADQGQADGVVLAGVDVWNGHARQGRNRGEPGGVLRETRDAALRFSWSHSWSIFLQVSFAAFGTSW